MGFGPCLSFLTVCVRLFPSYDQLNYGLWFKIISLKGLVRKRQE